MIVRYTETAADEIEQIFSYIAERNPAAARNVRARIEQTTGALTSFPYMAQMSDEPGVRVTPVGRFPYLIFYHVEKDEIVILHVRHSARQRPWEQPRVDD